MNRVAVRTARVAIVGTMIAAAMVSVWGRQALPRLAIDPPAGFFRSPGGDPNVHTYDSTIVNATLRIYAFRPFAGDVLTTFRQTLFHNWTPIDFEHPVVGTPEFGRGTAPGADAVLSARYVDTTGRAHLRIAIAASGNRAIALVHLRAATPSGLQQVLPSFDRVFASLRVTTSPPPLATGTGANTSAVAGLYLGSRLRQTMTGWMADTYFYLFSADGRVYRGYRLPKAPAGDLQRFDYAQAAELDPENAGTFTIKNGTLVLRMGWASPETITVAMPVDGTISIQGSTLTRQVK